MFPCGLRRASGQITEFREKEINYVVAVFCHLPNPSRPISASSLSRDLLVRSHVSVRIGCKEDPRTSYSKGTHAPVTPSEVPNRNSDPAARNNPGYHRTACSTPHVGHLLGRCFQRVPSRFSSLRRCYNRSRPRAPSSRGTNCLAAQRAPERITPPVMRVHQGAFSGTIYQRYARWP
ncbi:hypothetical protein Taro_022748 [Colocasia esculenta]|uniref:Uncharacterized protein n=1 Tax=Colocasia esculenta TaxID=4460 RepID=A0A843V8V0_COLES|nr:hypothetical protein [Colocasia esculenta]